MHLLSIGTDLSVFAKGSAAQKRQETYAAQFESFSLMVASRLRFDLVPKLIAHLARECVDVVTVQDPFETGFLTVLCLLGRNIPLHVQVHTDFLAPAFAQESLLNRVRVFLAGFVLRRAIRIRVVSDRIKKSIEERYRIEAPITVLPIYVDCARFRNAVADEALRAKFARFEKKLLVVSRLEREKNVELALRAFAHSYSKSECLIIVGEGREHARLERIAHEFDLEGFVFFEGARDPAPYYKIADILLVPSLYEGYGLVIVEALAAGIPVLSTDVGVAREAGAIVSSVRDFPDALYQWLSEGASSGTLKAYPYESEEEYVRAWVEDVKACTRA